MQSTLSKLLVGKSSWINFFDGTINLSVGTSDENEK